MATPAPNFGARAPEPPDERGQAEQVGERQEEGLWQIRVPTPGGRIEAPRRPRRRALRLRSPRESTARARRLPHGSDREPTAGAGRSDTTRVNRELLAREGRHLLRPGPGPGAGAAVGDRRLGGGNPARGARRTVHFTVRELGLMPPLRRCLGTTNLLDNAHSGTHDETPGSHLDLQLRLGLPPMVRESTELYPLN